MSCRFFQPNKNSRRGEIATIFTLLSLAAILVGTFLGTQQTVQESVQTYFSRAATQQSCSFRTKATVYLDRWGGHILEGEELTGQQWGVTSTINNRFEKFDQPSTENPKTQRRFDTPNLTENFHNTRHDVTLTYDFSTYEIIGVKCVHPQFGEKKGCEEFFAPSNRSPVLKNITVDCDVDIEYGWVVKRTMNYTPISANPQPTESGGIGPEPTIRNLRPTATTQQLCTQSGGTWRLFNNRCEADLCSNKGKANICQGIRDEFASCNCPGSACWTGSTCAAPTAIPSPTQIPLPTRIPTVAATGPGDMEVKVVALDSPQRTGFYKGERPATCIRNPNDERPLYLSIFTVSAINQQTGQRFNASASKNQGHVSFNGIPAGNYKLNIYNMGGKGFSMLDSCKDPWQVNSGGTGNNRTRAYIALQNESRGLYETETSENRCITNRHNETGELGSSNLIQGVVNSFCYYGTKKTSGPGGCTGPDLTCSGVNSSRAGDGNGICQSAGLGSWVGWCSATNVNNNACCTKVPPSPTPAPNRSGQQCIGKDSSGRDLSCGAASACAPGGGQLAPQYTCPRAGVEQLSCCSFPATSGRASISGTVTVNANGNLYNKVILVFARRSDSVFSGSGLNDVTLHYNPNGQDSTRRVLNYSIPDLSREDYVLSARVNGLRNRITTQLNNVYDTAIDSKCIVDSGYAVASSWCLVKAPGTQNFVINLKDQLPAGSITPSPTPAGDHRLVGYKITYEVKNCTPTYGSSTTLIPQICNSSRNPQCTMFNDKVITANHDGTLGQCTTERVTITDASRDGTSISTSCRGLSSTIRLAANRPNPVIEGKCIILTSILQRDFSQNEEIVSVTFDGSYSGRGLNNSSGGQTEQQLIAADIDKNKSVNSLDAAVCLAQWARNDSITAAQKTCDTNKDGNVNSVDYSSIYQLLGQSY